MIQRVVVQPFLGQHRLDDVLAHPFADLVELHALVVLRREHHRVDRDGLAVLVAQRDLALGVRTQPGQRVVGVLAQARVRSVLCLSL